MKQHFLRRVSWLSKVGGLLVCVGGILGIAASQVQAQVLVTGFYDHVGPSYFYSFQVQNQSAVDLSVVELTYDIAPIAPLITNEAPASGFTINVDSGTGSIVFAEDTTVFPANTTVDGFTLTSDQFLNITNVSGLDSSGQPFEASFSSVAAPETGTLPLVVLAGSSLLATVIARRRFSRQNG